MQPPLILTISPVWQLKAEESQWFAWVGKSVRLFIAPVPTPYSSAPRYPQVLLVCQMLPADLTYYGTRSYTVSLRSSLFCYNHQVPLTTQCVSVFVSRSKCLLCVDYVFLGKVNRYFMFYQVSLTCTGVKVG